MAPSPPQARLGHPGCNCEPNWRDLLSVQSVCNQWNGGTKELEGAKSSDWRPWSKAASKSKAFSRVKKTVKELGRLVEKESCSAPVAVERLQCAWTHFKSFSALADKIGKEGMDLCESVVPMQEVQMHCSAL